MDDDSRGLRHRIKNDLQLISSLVHLELGAATDRATKKALSAIDHRVLAVMMSYASRTNDTVSMTPYLAELCQAHARVTLTSDPRDLGEMPHGPATRVGLILVEILGAAEDDVTVIARKSAAVGAVGSRFHLDAKRPDNGGRAWLAGLPREIVTSLVRQLRGTIEEPTSDRIVVVVEA